MNMSLIKAIPLFIVVSIILSFISEVLLLITLIKRKNAKTGYSNWLQLNYKYYFNLYKRQLAVLMIPILNAIFLIAYIAVFCYRIWRNTIIAVTKECMQKELQ